MSEIDFDRFSKPGRMKKFLSLNKIKALNKVAIEAGKKPLYRVNEVVEPIPEGILDGRIDPYEENLKMLMETSKMSKETCQDALNYAKGNIDAAQAYLECLGGMSIIR